MTATVQSTVLVERCGRVLVITLNRPERRNAMSRAMADQVSEALDLLDADPALQVGVLTGAGGHFCAGMDLKDFDGGALAEVPGRGFGGLTERPPKKVLIAAVEGFALAGGCELVMACDLAVAGEGSRFGVPEVTRGLVPGQGGLNRLARLVPERIALELVVTGRRFSAAEAHGWGLVNMLAPDGFALDGALELAEVIQANSPQAVTAAKSVMTKTATLPIEETWAVQADEVAAVIASADAREGAKAFVEKRAPIWPSSHAER